VTHRAAVVLALVASLLAGVATPAEARDGRRRVAILEHRTGVTRAADLAARMAAVLARSAALEVVSPEEARRRLQGRLDALIARCAGDPPCVAHVGEKINVDEVILVGISQLGDVILALQRIGVRTRSVEGRIAEALSPGTEPGDEMLLGYLRRLLPPEDFRRYGGIRVKANVTGAEIALDGLVRGRTPLTTLQVEAPRRYQLTVRKPGFIDFNASLDVQPDGTVEVTPDLHRRPTALAWYQRWWVWGIAAAVAAGTATALALTLAPRGSHDITVWVDPNRR
jgi:hypothetical protein